MRSLVRFICLCTMLATSLSLHAADIKTTVTKVREIRERGDFKKAADVLNTSLADKGLSESDKKQLRYELDLLERIQKDFSLTKKNLFGSVQKAVRDLSREEFERWVKEGRFETRTIDGTVLYPGTSTSNLFWRYPDLNTRRITPRSKNALYRAMLDNSRLVTKVAAAEKTPYVLQQELEVTMTVKAQSDAAPASEIIRAWLPIPRKLPFQDGFKLLESSSKPKYIAEEESNIRSVYLEQPAAPAGETIFQIKYRYSTRATRFDLNVAKSQELKVDAKLQPFLQESPHVVFTPEIKRLAAEIVGKETNALKKARAIYDWIGKRIQYSYALEYSTIPNISEYCRKNDFGDCGQQALLYITLCRAEGIPARWQSGWFLFPGGQNMHDWTEIYLAPWGWVPVDVEVGGAFLKYANGLSAQERTELNDFYFGGLDQYRLIANGDHSQELNPAKQTFRSDDVDFQRGELETSKGNIYFDKYSYDVKWEKVK